MLGDLLKKVGSTLEAIRTNPGSILPVVTAPDYRLALVTDGGEQDLTPLIRQHLVSLDITDNRTGHSDQLTLVLEDTRGDIEIPPSGAKLKASIGWKGEALVDKGTFEVQEATHSGPPDLITIVAYSAGLAGPLTEKKNRSWHGVALGEMVATIASEAELIPRVSAVFSQESIPHIDQTDESDINLLSRIAERLDALCTVKAGFLLFLPAGRHISASGQNLPPALITRSDSDTHTWRSPTRDRYTGVLCRWRNTRKNRNEEYTAGLQGRRKQLRGTYPTEHEAKRAAEAEWRRLQRDNFTLELTLDKARPALTAETPVICQGWGKPQIDGVAWLVVSVALSLSDSGLTQRLSLEQLP
ncbi:contractile injection system protein, VgrG/Pvc8 family [Alloalcanivorax xenomutans]|uniref:contractile injection system protein, VgrG/Pvc8 family n=1 Tax=Alloalcanivorax xenomutans TaxID=1094342 RepID=UPI003BAC5843